MRSSENPPENTRVLFLSTSEEALCEGMGLFMERHAAELPVDRTFFLCLDTIGSPHLLVLRGEGMLKLREYPAESLELLDSTAEELGIDLFPNLRLRNATDGVFPLAAGYQCVSVASCNQWKNPSNYHWKTDLPEHVDYGTVAEAIQPQRGRDPQARSALAVAVAEYERSDRTRVFRKPGRGSHDRELIHSILDEALVCHVGFVHDGQPYVFPRSTPGRGRSSTSMARAATARSGRSPPAPTAA